MKNPSVNTVTVDCFEAFTTVPGKGNPAGVVFDADFLTETQMQEIAKKVGFNETAFLVKSDKADLRIRYFTPGHEMNLCGHGTIASVFGLLQRKNAAESTTLTIETLAGILTVQYNHEQQEVEMAQAPAEFITYNGNVDELAKSIGITSDDIATEYPVLYGSTGIWTVILPIKSLEAFSRMKPGNQQFKNILTQIPTASVHPICMQTYDKTCAMHGRHFSASQSGTVEDPVTGTASGVMGAYYINYVHPSAQAELLVEQGNEMGREGIVRVKASKKEPSIEVTIAGKAVYNKGIEIAY